MDEEELWQIDQPRGRYTHWRQYKCARWRIIRFVNIFKNHLLKKSICITLLPVINCQKHNENPKLLPEMAFCGSIPIRRFMYLKQEIVTEGLRVV